MNFTELRCLLVSQDANIAAHSTSLSRMRTTNTTTNTDQHPPTMASNIPSAARDPAVPSADGTCDFYNLPRELRDEVYSFAFAGQRVMLAPAVGAVIVSSVLTGSRL